MSRARLVLAVLALGVVAVTVASAAPPRSGGSNASISISDVSATEGNAGTRSFSFTVQVSGSLKGSAGVSYSTANGTALAPGDYAAAAGSLSFDRRTKTRTVAVQVVG